MDEAQAFTSKGFGSGGLRDRAQRRRAEMDADPTAGLPFGSDGPRCESCGAANPTTVVACIVCGLDLLGPIGYQIVGTTMPALEITLDPGQRIYAETGCLGWMTDTVRMQTVMAGSPWALL